MTNQVDNQISAATPGEEEKQVRRFKPLRDLPPFFIAGLILYFVLHGLAWDKIAQAMGRANLPLFAAGAAIFTAAHFLTNCVSYFQMYNWFLVRIRFAEVMKAFAGSLLPQAAVTALGQAIFYIYMIRNKRVRILHVLGASMFYIFNDLWVMAIVLTVALLVMPDTEPAVYVWYGLLLPGVLFATWYFPLQGGKRFLTRVYDSPLAVCLREARSPHYAKFLPVRLLFPVFQVVGHMIALRAMGIDAPLGAVIVIVTVMTMTSFMPVSALGMGAPNWAALYFAPYVASPDMAAETAAAYGLLFQTCFLIGRMSIGLVAAGPFWREFRKPRPQAGSQTPSEIKGE